MPGPLNPDLVSKQFMIRNDQHEWLEDQAFRCKRSGEKDKDSISKLVRIAIDQYIAKTKRTRG